MSREEDRKVEQKMLDTISEVIKGTNWEPPESGILVDALVVMIYQDTDGDYGMSWMSAGSSAQAEGMAMHVQRAIETKHSTMLSEAIINIDDEED
jgi:hypothetical protein